MKTAFTCLLVYLFIWVVSADSESVQKVGVQTQTQSQTHALAQSQVEAQTQNQGQAQAQAQTQGFGDSIMGVAGAAVQGLGFAAGVLGNRMPADVEDCVACRYVWLQVEMDVGNSQVEENIYDSFYQNALEAQKAPIFYPACQTMFDSIDDMISDYMDGYTVNQMCENSMLCR